MMCRKQWKIWRRRFRCCW